MAPDVSVVIVSYNTREILRACLASLAASEAVRLETFVVDNGSRDGSPDMVEQAFPSVVVLRQAENRGFAAANNVALTRASGRFVLLLNPDTIVRNRTIATLVACLGQHAKAGIVGPLVLNEDGTVQSCGYRYPSLAGEIRQSKNVGRMLRWLVGAEPEPIATSKVEEVDWVDGCCLMIRHDIVRQVGFLDEQYFLYSEELDWCRSVHKAGWNIVTCPSAVMTHLRGRSSDQVKAASLALLVETKLRYFRKHDGLLTAAAVSAVYVLGFLKQWRHEPEKNRAKMQGVTAWWRSVRATGPGSWSRPWAA